MKLVNCERSVIRAALNLLWSEYVRKKCPKKVVKDLDKYHQWCQIEEKDRMSDLYWIQSVRKKLNEEERKVLCKKQK